MCGTLAPAFFSLNAHCSKTMPKSLELHLSSPPLSIPLFQGFEDPKDKWVMCPSLLLLGLGAVSKLPGARFLCSVEDEPRTRSLGHKWTEPIAPERPAALEPRPRREAGPWYHPFIISTSHTHTCTHPHAHTTTHTHTLCMCTHTHTHTHAQTPHTHTHTHTHVQLPGWGAP